MIAELVHQVGFVARRSVRRTLRQPALIVPTLVFLVVSFYDYDRTGIYPDFLLTNYEELLTTPATLRVSCRRSAASSMASTPSSRSPTSGRSPRCARSRSRRRA